MYIVKCFEVRKCLLRDQGDGSMFGRLVLTPAASAAQRAQPSQNRLCTNAKRFLGCCHPQKSSAALGFKSLVTTQAANASPRITEDGPQIARTIQKKGRTTFGSRCKWKSKYKCECECKYKCTISLVIARCALRLRVHDPLRDLRDLVAGSQEACLPLNKIQNLARLHRRLQMLGR